MDNINENLDITVLTRDYSSEVERAIAVRNYLKTVEEAEKYLKEK